jgi:hypothetical protein
MAIGSNSGKIEILKSVSSTLHTKVYRAFDGIKFGKTKTPWVFVTNSPIRVLAGVRQVTWISIFQRHSLDNIDPGYFDSNQ